MTTTPPDSSIDWRTDEAVLTTSPAPAPAPAPVQVPDTWTGWQAITETGRAVQLEQLHHLQARLDTWQTAALGRVARGSTVSVDWLEAATGWLNAVTWAIAYIEAH